MWQRLTNNNQLEGHERCVCVCVGRGLALALAVTRLIVDKVAGVDKMSKGGRIELNYISKSANHISIWSNHISICFGINVVNLNKNVRYVSE